MTLAAGARLGIYEIQSLLGAGGMGEVYKARDTRLGREVAIKALPSAFALDRDRLARFEREAQLLAALNHPNIAGIHGVQEHDGRTLLVLEFVPGETLAEKLASGFGLQAAGLEGTRSLEPEPRSVTGGLALREILDIARQMAEALEAAHEKGIIHREIRARRSPACAADFRRHAVGRMGLRVGARPDQPRDARCRKRSSARVDARWPPTHLCPNRADNPGRKVYWQRADGTGDVQRLTDGTNPQTPGSWHPTGRILLFTEINPQTQTDLMILRMEGDEKSGWKPGKPSVFLNSPFNEINPAFSPDGRWVAYASNESGRQEVYVRPFPGPGGQSPKPVA